MSDFCRILFHVLLEYRKLGLLTATSFFFSSIMIFSQNCLSPLNGAVVNFTCNQTCSTVVFQIPHLKSSSDYSLISIPYNPYPFVTSTGLSDPTLYQDDKYSNVINLPFTFCFYDSMFTKAVVGSNGLMTFEQAVGGCDNSYPINNPIPFAGT